MQAAADALQDLDIDQTRPVDPFDAVARLDLELLFAPLDNLLGAIVPSPTMSAASGVLITTERQASIQRYTAAHEIGHWYLDQDYLAVDIQVDTQDEVVGIPSNERERRAQLFASYFLMPLPLVSRTARRHGLRRGDEATAVQAYAIARDMHVSFEAATRQLYNCGFILDSNVRSLLKSRPISVKSELALGHRPTEARGDVWTVAGEDPPAELEVFEGDDVVVSLPENRTTGYRWLSADKTDPARRPARPAPPSFGGTEGELDTASDRVDRQELVPRPELETSLPLVYDDFQLSSSAGPADAGLPVGGGGNRYLILYAQAPGVWEEHFQYASPFRPDSEPIDDVRLRFAVRPKPAVETRQRWLDEFKRAPDFND
ncbi:ImmA/IrrE family metallo-endopeptidase [Agromyces mariniharenae]|nr:ImmA/IrrE family metallo-endopeptidase [Agromyces mariniharenae]